MRGNRVLIVYHYVALYRYPIFKQLLMDGDFNVYIASDYISNNDIKLADLDSGDSKKRHYRLSNVWIKNRFLWQKNLLSLIFSRDFDKVVFLGDPHFLSTWVALLVARLMGVKTYLWTHGFLHRSGKLLDMIKIFMYRLSNGVLLYGNEAKQDLIASGYEQRRLHVIYNSLDYDLQKLLREQVSEGVRQHLREQLFKNPDRLQLIFIGRLTFHKKLDMLIDAIYFLNKTQPVNLLLVGEGEACAVLKCKIAEYGLEDSVCFYGACHDEYKLAPLICSSDVCVSPGEVGLTAMHSLAYGVPVITHNNRFKQMPEYEAVVDGVTGFLFEHDSLESLVEKLSLLRDAPLEQYKANCIEIIEKRYTPTMQSALIKSALGLNDEA